MLGLPQGCLLVSHGYVPTVRSVLAIFMSFITFWSTSQLVGVLMLPHFPKGTKLGEVQGNILWRHYKW